jgi:YidC/Oxa1 family membrane protein insertase
MSALLGVPLDAAYHLVYGLTTLLTPVLGGLAGAVAIIVCTAAVRLAVMPLSFRALRGQAAQARLAPRVAALRTRYGAEPERFGRELSELYRSEGTSVYAGFAPLLAQWPVFSVLYLLFRSPVVAGGANRLLSRELFGVPLGSHWLSGAGAFGAPGAVFLGLFALLTVICWLSARVARSMSATATATATSAAPGALRAGTGADAALGAVGRVLPYVTVVIAVFAPLAAGIYLVTSTAWSVAERRVGWRARSKVEDHAIGSRRERRSRRQHEGPSRGRVRLWARSGWTNGTKRTGKHPESAQR